MDRLTEIIRVKAAASSQVAIARELGITQATLSRLLSGKRKPGRKVLVGIVKAWPQFEAEAIDYLRQL